MLSTIRPLVDKAVGVALDIIFGYFWTLVLGFLFHRFFWWALQDALFPAPRVTVPLEEAEGNNVIKRKKFNPTDQSPKKMIPCWDPSTMDSLGTAKICSRSDVASAVAKARKAQQKWSQSSFAQREMLMRIILRYVVENQDTIARVAVRESGKTLVDAFFGEIMVTCEKLKWLIAEGRHWLKDECRSTGSLMMLKRVHVEYQPFGVIGAIVPWNYPFHNVFNPVTAALFSGNGIVIKVSEFASWSVSYFERVIRACLKAANAPEDLVQFVTGYGETGNALVTSGVDKLIFVGSPGIGIKVMEAAAPSLTPVVLELGGKDPFIVCNDADVSSVAQTACRGVFQNMGQNCAGPERFFVMESAYDEFCEAVSSIISKLCQGPPLAVGTGCFTDCGAITMGRKQMLSYQKLVDDAVRRGARVLRGGRLPSEAQCLIGSFYPPTLVVDVPENAMMAREEIFGPIMCVMKIAGDSDDEAVRMANSCDFALSSCVFSRDAARAYRIGARLKAGMFSANDLEGTTYMSQSLPFGGRGKSGFGRFAGPEGLRGLCMVRSVCRDLIPSVPASIPAPLQYPSTGVGIGFASGLIQTFYGYGFWERVKGVLSLLALVAGPKPKRPAALSMKQNSSKGSRIELNKP